MMDNRNHIIVCIKCGDNNLVKDYRYNNLIQWSWKCQSCDWEDRRINADLLELSREFNGKP